MIDVEKFIMNIRVHLLRQHPFYGHVLMQLPIIYTDKEVPTMGVGKSSKDEIMIKLYVNTDYINRIIEICKKDETKVINHFTEILKHEVHHLVFGHLNIELPDTQRKLIACELSDNSYINRYHLVSETEEKAGVFPEDFDLPNKLSVYEYYNLLNDNQKFNEIRKNQIQIKVSINNEDGEGGNGKSDNDNNSNNSDMSGQSLDSHDKWEVVEGDNISKEMIRDIIRQANETCKQSGSWGDVPGEIKEAINLNYSTAKQIIPWEVVLKDFLASSSETILDYTNKRKSRRFGTRPGTKKQEMLNVAIGIDTSGSIDDEMLKLFFQELQFIDKAETNITVFEWDTQVNREYNYKYFDFNITGRGGTDPTDFLEKISERKFDCAIVFTDLYFSEIKKDYKIPTIWVCDRNGYNWEKENNYCPVKNTTIFNLNKDKTGFNVVYV